MGGLGLRHEGLDWSSRDARRVDAGCSPHAPEKLPELLLSGPQGGDVQIAGRIAESKLDGLFFFWDAAARHPHEADVRALIRLASLHGLPVALNRSTAGLLIEGFRRQMGRLHSQGEWRGRHRGAVQVG